MLNKLNKSLTIFISVLILISSIPVIAFAATSLTNRNVEIVVPTVTPNEITYGQTLGEVTVTGGEVWYNGTQIPGYFTVSSTTMIPAASDAFEMMFKFVPTDSNYTCRATFRKANTTYTGTWPTIKVKAEAVATLAEAPVASPISVGGTTLPASKLSGGKVVDANGNDITALGTWAWVAPSTRVSESGTYTAQWTAINNDYNPVTVDVFVTVETVQIETCFVDENGNTIVPEIKMPINSELNLNVLTPYIEKFTANCGEFSVLNIFPTSIDTSSLGEYEYRARILPKDNTYTTADLTFKLIVEPLEVSPYFIAYGNDKYEITTGNYQTKPKGTYDLYVNGELVMEDIAYQTRFTWRPEKSDIYTLKAVYNPVENDTFKVNDAMCVDMVLNLVWDINCVNSKANPCAYGEKAIVLHELGNKFAGWVVYDQNGNEFTPENMVADTSTSSLTFTMPDFPVTVKALTTEDVTGEDNSDTSLLGWFQKLIKWIIDIVSHILNFWN